MSIDSFFKGYPPIVKVTPGNPEAEKYGKLWEMKSYRRIAPGEFYSQLFLNRAKPRPGAHIIDFGCGTGRGAVMLATLGGLKVTMVDFVNNCLDPKVRDMIGNWEKPSLTFVKADLEKPIPVKAEYGFTSDVMEHIPPDKVDLVLNNILLAAQSVWFTIALFDDSFGQAIMEKLHLTVRPFEWWKEQFEKRDCQIIHAENQDDMYAHFYVRAWQDGKAVVDHGIMNTEEKQIIENVKHNIAQGWQQVTPHETNELECMILGGGPSLNQFEDEIKKNRAEGVKLITLNGSYNWAIAHGLTPSAQIIVDARPFNARFTKPVVSSWQLIRLESEKSTGIAALGADGCVLEYKTKEEALRNARLIAQREGFRFFPAESPTYLIASQCHPSVFEGLPKYRTYIWHTMAEQIQDILDQQYGSNQWWPIPGGSTVLLRAIPLMRMLGYHKFILYGCDSCLADDGRHHAFDQPENDIDYSIPVIVNPSGRVFKCAASMVSQATEFLDLIKYLGNEIDLDVKGDGLLAHIVEVGAEQAEIQKL